MRIARIVLVLAGVALTFGGGVLLLTTQRIDQLGGLALWLAGAIIVHDAILSPLVLAASLLARRAGVRVGWVPIAVLQVALVIGGVVSLFVVPEIVAQARRPSNPTILTQPYALHLAVFWAVLLVAAVAVAAGYVIRTRQKDRPPASQR